MVVIAGVAVVMMIVMMVRVIMSVMMAVIVVRAGISRCAQRAP
jgi:hypothetical protein